MNGAENGKDAKDGAIYQTRARTDDITAFRTASLARAKKSPSPSISPPCHIKSLISCVILTYCTCPHNWMITACWWLV